MKKYLIAILYALILFLCARQCLNYFYNEHVIKQMEKGDYSVNDNLLENGNFIHGYYDYDGNWWPA